MEQMCTDYQEHVQRAAPGAEAAEYIVSPCGFAALALSEIFNAEQKKYRVLTKLADLKDTDILLKLHETPILRATVYLPLEPVPFLQTLRVLTLLLRNSTIPLDILIITRCSSGWLYKTLLRILRKPFYLSAITVVDVGVSGSFINEVLLQKCHAPTLALHARQESSNIQRNLRVLMKVNWMQSITTCWVNLSKSSITSQDSVCLVFTHSDGQEYRKSDC